MACAAASASRSRAHCIQGVRTQASRVAGLRQFDQSLDAPIDSPSRWGVAGPHERAARSTSRASAPVAHLVARPSARSVPRSFLLPRQDQSRGGAMHRCAERATVGERAVSAELTPWIVFLVAVAALLAIDLGVLGRRGGVMSTQTALLWSAMWIGLGPLVLARRVGLAGVGGRAGVPRRLPHRGVAEHRQPLRLPARLRLPRHRPALPAQGALLGHPRGDRHARRVHRRRRGACSSASRG